MKSPFSARSTEEPTPQGIIETLRSRSSATSCSATALAVSILPAQVELLTLLIRCQSFEEVQRLASAVDLKAGTDGARVVLATSKGMVVAQAWLFD
jgi:hypothetical protein